MQSFSSKCQQFLNAGGVTLFASGTDINAISHKNSIKDDTNSGDAQQKSQRFDS